jgi:hypothetical protein
MIEGSKQTLSELPGRTAFNYGNSEHCPLHARMRPTPPGRNIVSTACGLYIPPNSTNGTLWAQCLRKGLRLFPHDSLHHYALDARNRAARRGGVPAAIALQCGPRGYVSCPSCPSCPSVFVHDDAHWLRAILALLSRSLTHGRRALVLQAATAPPRATCRPSRDKVRLPRLAGAPSRD